MSHATNVHVRPVTDENWTDFTRLFESRGSPHNCWCSIAPRESYVQLQRSRTMPRATPPATPTWVVLCFFVTRPHRGRDVTAALLRGAVAYARENGAAIIEGYPFDTAGVSSTHRGHSSVFRAAGFERDDKRWSLRLERR